MTPRYAFAQACVMLSAGVFLLAAGATPSPQNYRPAGGYVPDKRTAISIAVAVLTPIYGRKQIPSEMPFSAELRGNRWFVYGYLPAGYDGGVAEISISKTTGEILSVNHGK